MPISYKHKIYTTLGTPTGLSGNVVSATDSAGVPAKDYTIKGKTIVWNQLLDKSKYPATTTQNGVTFTNNGDGTITANGTATANADFRLANNKYKILANHKCLITGGINSNVMVRFSGDPTGLWEDKGGGVITNQTVDTIAYNFSARVNSGTTVSNITFKPQLFDLTQMFGAGNEPATVAEFRAMFPDDYYPYNAGELKTIVPISIEANGVERFQLLDKSKYPATTTINGVTFTNNGDGTFTVNGNATNSAYIQLNTITMKLRHKYLINDGDAGVSFGSYCTYLNVNGSNVANTSSSNEMNIYTANQNILCICYIRVSSGIEVPTVVFKPQLFDLTEMFGAGNEPATVAEFWQRVPEKLYGYNPNDYKSANIPSSKYFPDGMRSAGSAYDEINFLSQKAIKRIGAVDMGTLNWSYVSTASRERLIAMVDGIKITLGSAKGNLVCSKYTTTSVDDVYLHTADKTIAVHNTAEQVWVYDTAYTDAAAFKAAMSGVMLYYELATPVETAITPSLQALPTYKGFTSFSAPNSLTQNGPLSVTYYAEGGTNPEKGWLTSYKRKLYMGRSIEWNQLLDKSKFAATRTVAGVTVKNNGDGTYTLNGTYTSSGTNWFAIYYDDDLSIAKRLYGHKVLYGFNLSVNSGPKNTPYGMSYEINRTVLNGTQFYGNNSCVISQTLNAVSPSDITDSAFYIVLRPPSSGTAVYNNVVIRPQLFDLTQMFGAGNEPATPAEFWSYFDNKLYPYNPGEAQPLFKISRKSLWAVAPKHYTARWDKVHAAMVRLNDAASFPTNITNFAHRGSVNANYSNPFDNIYPWSGIKLCNISIDLYRNLVAGDSITKCVTAWEGDANFSYNDVNGVWRYRPEFWGKSWEDNTYRYFDVTDQNVHGSNYVHYPEAIVGRWHGRKSTLTIGGAEKTCLVPSVGMPAKRIAMNTLHTYAKNYGATIDSIFSVDADVLLCIVEFATMNTQKAIGNGVSTLYRQSSDLIQEDATNSAVVKVLASAASAYCIPGAIFDIGTSNGGVQVGSFTVVSVAQNAVDAKYLDVTLDKTVTVTTANYWSVHGLANAADEEIGSKSGYIGTNGKCNSYYRGLVLFGNMFLYTLGAYENCKDQHIWIANSDEEADNYDALNTSVHYDTGLVLPTAGGYTKKLGMLSRSGLLSIPVFCTETGGDNSNPTGDYFYNGVYTNNTVLIRGGDAAFGSAAGAFYGYWYDTASHSSWTCAARPRLKNP